MNLGFCYFSLLNPGVSNRAVFHEAQGFMKRGAHGAADSKMSGILSRIEQLVKDAKEAANSMEAGNELWKEEVHTAIDGLAQIARDLTGVDAPQNSTPVAERRLEVLCPSLKELLDTLDVENRELSGDDRCTANRICLEIATNADLIMENCKAELSRNISRLPLIMDRILLFESEKIDIRAHLFVAGAEETFIHNHGQSFISTCVEGSYVHKLWSTEEGNSVHYVHKRLPSGIYSEPVVGTGALENILCQPFSAGQSLFISPCAKHTVEASKDGPLVTITIRNKRKRFNAVDVLSPSSLIESPTESVIPVNRPELVDPILKRFHKSLGKFQSILIGEPRDPYIALEEIKGSVAKLAVKSDLQETEVLNELVLATASILCMEMFTMAEGYSSAMELRLKALLTKLGGHNEFSRREGGNIEMDGNDGLIANLQNTFTGVTLARFNHLLFCFGYANHPDYFHPESQKVFWERISFPDVSPALSQYRRGELTQDWMLSFLDAHKLRLRPLL